MKHPEWLTMSPEQRAIALEYAALGEYLKAIKKSKRTSRRNRKADIEGIEKRLVVLRYQYAGVVPPEVITQDGDDEDKPKPPPPPPPWW